MPLESATYISDLDPSNPVGSSDLVSSLDDHMRLVKATLQTTFPGITGEVTATHVELNRLDGVTGTTGTGKLVLDDAPTIADLTVTDSVTLPANSVADAALSDNVPLKNAPNTFTASNAITLHSSNLCSLRFRNDAEGSIWDIEDRAGTFAIRPRTDDLSLGTSAFIATSDTSANVLQTALAATVEIDLTAPTLDFNGNADISGDLKVNSTALISHATRAGLLLERTGSGENEKLYEIAPGSDSLVIRSRTDADGSGSNLMVASRSGTTWTTVSWAQGNHSFAGDVSITGAVTAGTAATSTSATLAAGRIHHRSSNTTVPSMNAGQWVAVQNTSTSSITLSQGSGVTLELAGTTTTGNRTLAAKGFAFIYFRANGVGVCGGAGVS